MACSTIVILCLLAFAVSLPVTSDYYNTWYVSVTGDNKNSGASDSSPVLDIATAMGKAKAGDTIKIMPGQYIGKGANTGLTFPLAITLRSYNTDIPVVRCVTASENGWSFEDSGVVTDIHFQSCGAALTFATKGTVVSVTVDAATDAAVRLVGATAQSLSVKSSSFTKNYVSVEICKDTACADASVSLSGLTIVPGSSSPKKLAGLYLGQATVTLEDSTLNTIYGDCSGKASEGKLVINHGGDLTMSNTVLSASHSFATGGAYLQDSGAIATFNNVTFDSNDVGGLVGSSNTAYGGAVYCASGRMVIHDSEFRNNTVGYASYATAGGALYSAGSCSVNLFDTDFDSNSLYSGSGGAYACATPGSVYASHCTFENNKPNDKAAC